MSPLLRVESLGVVFSVAGGKKLRALHDVSLTVDRGQILAVVGESGSGKSTIGRALVRLLEPTSGQIVFDGRDVLATERGGASNAYRRRVQMVFQDPFASLNPVHSVAHHVLRPMAIHGTGGADPRAKAIALLEQVGLSPGATYIDKLPHELSGGQRQRVAIARALACDPELLVADEPTSMLDVSIRMDVLRLFERLRSERGLAIVLITHDLAAARYVADRVLVLYAGQLMEEVPAPGLARSASHPYTRLLVAAAPRPGGDLTEALPARPGVPKTVDPPPGCPFAARCLDAVEACSSTLPAVSAGALGHRVRCHVHGAVAG